MEEAGVFWAKWVISFHYIPFIIFNFKKPCLYITFSIKINKCLATLQLQSRDAGSSRQEACYPGITYLPLSSLQLTILESMAPRSSDAQFS